ncbi:DUF928 domain-containing protein [Laspinema olomoucense]|uniref:DUF928 domain-containing protein n=1 Tax=Laspinema olomoucense TaxID=3231600 RepID=UPI0021BB8F17|nr:DUF928 domain-containing protein [Laspinema sp. D3c]MCT7997556.1 DUF928 domain-containing protein [Laspinema sp. D3c]
MIYLNPKHWKLMIAVVLSIGLNIATVSQIPKISAAEETTSNSASTESKDEEMKLPSGVGNPSRRQDGAAGRTGNPEGDESLNSLCQSVTGENLERSLVALIPEVQSSEENADSLPDGTIYSVGTTLEIEPTVFVYIPELVKEGNLQVIQAEVRFVDNRTNQFIFDPQRILIDVSKTPGIIGITLPVQIENIEFDERGRYRWSFELLCNPNPDERATNPSVDGWIEWVNLSDRERQQLKEATSEQKLEFYFERRIWHDLIALLAQYRQLNDSRFEQYWSSILKQVDLDSLADEDIIDIVKVNLGRRFSTRA